MQLRNTFGWLVMAAAITTGMSSCSSDDSVLNEQPTETTPQATAIHVSVGAGIDDGATTRSAVDKEGTTRTLKFTEGDKLYIYRSIKYQSSPYITEILYGELEMKAGSISSDGKSATFEGDVKVYDQDGNVIAYDFGGEDPLVSSEAYLCHKDMKEGVYKFWSNKMLEIDVKKWTAASVDELMTTAIKVSGLYKTSTKSYPLSTENPIINCDIRGLDPSTEYEFYLTSNGYSLSSSEMPWTTDASGRARFAFASTVSFTNGLINDLKLNVKKKDGNELLVIDLPATKLDVKVYNVVRYYNGTSFDKATVDLSDLTSNYTLQDGQTLTGTLTNKVQVSIAPGATVTLKDAIVRCPDDTDAGTNNGMNWAGITCQGNATIVLEGANTARGFNYKYPGVYVPSGSTLTIKGTGSLTASGPTGSYACGIGGGRQLSNGNIEVQGGTIIANGGDWSAGIGGSSTGEDPISCGYITISGGTVTATGKDCPGIGAGCGSSKPATCGDITISGGTVTAIKEGTAGGAAIGNSVHSTCSKVTITDGVQSLTMTNASASDKKTSKYLSATAVYVGATDITSNIGLDVDDATIQGYMTGLGFTTQTYDSSTKTWSMTK